MPGTRQTLSGASWLYPLKVGSPYPALKEGAEANTELWPRAYSISSTIGSCGGFSGRACSPSRFYRLSSTPTYFYGLIFLKLPFC